MSLMGYDNAWLPQLVRHVMAEEVSPISYCLFPILPLRSCSYTSKDMSLKSSAQWYFSACVDSSIWHGYVGGM